MKLLRYGKQGSEKPGILDDKGAIRDLSGIVNDINGQALSAEALAKISACDIDQLPAVSNEERIGACVDKVGKFICIGLNYADHAEEAGMPIPKEPVVFTKTTSSICGPNDNVKRPRNSEKLDWEVELAIVMGRHASYLDENEAEEAIAGYCICNDISEREFQLERSGQWDLGKGCDTFGPIGPWLVTKDEIDDVENLDMWLDVNGSRRQTGNTRTMIFKPAFIVSFLSQYMSLQPGDVISTGTPPGVALGKNPSVYLKDGDKMTLGIEGLGTQEQIVVSAE